MMRCCKTCKHLRVAPDARGRIVVRKDNAYPCDVPLPVVLLPDSVTSSYRFRWPPARFYMAGDKGTLCPTWEPRTPTQDTTP